MTEPAALRIGVDVSGTKIEAIALDGRGRELARRRVPTPRDDYEATIQVVAELVRAIEAGQLFGFLGPNGAGNNIATFYENITGKRFDNPTVVPSVRSNLVTILGRTAAYEDRPVYWDKLIKSEARLEANLKGLKA